MIINYGGGRGTRPQNFRNPKTPCSGGLVYRPWCPHSGAGVKDLKGDALTVQSLLRSCLSKTPLLQEHTNVCTGQN